MGNKRDDTDFWIGFRMGRYTGRGKSKKPPLNHTPKPGSKYARQILTQEQSVNLIRDGIPIDNIPRDLYVAYYGPKQSWIDFKLFLIGYFR